MLNEFIDHIQNVQDFIQVDDVFDLSESALDDVKNSQLRKDLGTPDIRPCMFDVSIEAWLYRISRWGKMKITHEDPDAGGRKREISQKGLENALTEPNFLKMFGKWKNEVLDINKLLITRSYVSLAGKKKEEKILITIDLKPELKKSLK